MRVELIRHFFAPDGRLLEPGVHEVPDDWTLPSSAKKEPEKPKGKK